MKGPEGYGRYNDDPTHIGCPRAKSDMTPCVARDGCLAVTDENDQLCAGCDSRPSELLKQLVRAVTEPAERGGIWLRAIGDEIQVLAEVNGKWKLVITEQRDGPMSHIVEPAGIMSAPDDLVTSGD